MYEVPISVIEILPNTVSASMDRWESPIDPD